MVEETHGNERMLDALDYLRGTTTTLRNHQRGISLLLQNAERYGHTRSMVLLGMIYTGGYYFQCENRTLAIEWFSKAVTAGDQLAICRAYRDGICGFEKNRTKHWDILCTLDSTDLLVEYFLAVAYRGGYGVYGDIQKCLELFQHGASENFAFACFDLGMMNYYGVGVRRSNAKMIEYLSIAFEQGHGESALVLGLFYKGGGMPEESVKYLEQATLLDVPSARYTLAYLFLLDFSVMDQTRGLRLLEEGVEKNMGDCVTALGNCYMYGTSVDIDERRGVLLWKRAVKLGDKLAAKSIAELCGRTGISQTKQLVAYDPEFHVLLARGTDHLDPSFLVSSGPIN